jgi:hypothetical protein
MLFKVRERPYAPDLQPRPTPTFVDELAECAGMTIAAGLSARLVGSDWTSAIVISLTIGIVWLLVRIAKRRRASTDK